MNDSYILSQINFELLKFIRDSKPSQKQMLDWLGENQKNTFFVLLKADLITIKNKTVHLSSKNLFDGEKIFAFSNHAFYIDEEIEKIVQIVK